MGLWVGRFLCSEWREGGVTWEDREMGRVHTGALELEGYKVSCTDSPGKVRGQ